MKNCSGGVLISLQDIVQTLYQEYIGSEDLTMMRSSQFGNPICLVSSNKDHHMSVIILKVSQIYVLNLRLFINANQISDQSSISPLSPFISYYILSTAMSNNDWLVFGSNKIQSYITIGWKLPCSHLPQLHLPCLHFSYSHLHLPCSYLSHLTLTPAQLAHAHTSFTFLAQTCLPYTCLIQTCRT